jgi:hypothetical protein
MTLMTTLDTIFFGSTSNKGGLMVMFAKNKSIMMLLAIVVVGTLFGGMVVVAATDGINPLDEIGRTVAHWISSQEAAKDLENQKVTNESNVSFYELAYANATSEQKEELDKIVADQSIGLPGEWRRAVLIAIGDLPQDQPRLTAEQAGHLYDSKDVSTLESEFNKIAGAPDFVGGSGIERSIYYLNDNRSEAIILMLNDVYHIVYKDDGTQTRLPIGNQELPITPSPTKAPLP